VTPLAESFGTPGRGPRLLGTGRGPRLLGGGKRSVVISTISSIAFVGLIVLGFLEAPGSASVRRSFLSGKNMIWAFKGNHAPGLYGVGAAIFINIKMFLIAEVLILVLALVIALVRQSHSPVMFPVRVLATMYVDFFRGVPLILVIYAIGLGAPAMYLKGISTQTAITYAVTALVLSYSAYVSEVYRAGLNSVHQSQAAAARSLGLSHWTSMRYVILPQAIRNIIPPLLNDFISLQKDTALAGVIGVVEANQAAQIYAANQFNFSSFVVAAGLFLVLTIPLARFTDHLISKDRRLRLAGALR
jgi:polar amino acid transport system permease protein